jgi:hypothetical protein
VNAVLLGLGAYCLLILLVAAATRRSKQRRRAEVIRDRDDKVHGRKNRKDSR